MKKTIQPLFISLFVLLITASPIHALSIVINDNGTISISQGKVLGEEEDEEEDEDETEVSENERKEEQKIKEERKQVEQRKEIKNVGAQEKKQLRVKNDTKKTEILIEKKELRKEEKLRKEQLVNQEKVETDDLEIEVPVQLKDDKNKRLEEREANQEIKKVLQERRERKDKLEIKTETREDGTRETNLEAGEIKARLKAAEFVVDPETNNVTITTPSGNTHTLVHLPDQALAQMEKAGLIDSTDPTAQSELEVETKDDGTVIYKAKFNQKRRLFGFIPYEAEKEVVLEDASGLTTEKTDNQSFLDRWMLRLSNEEVN